MSGRGKATSSRNKVAVESESKIKVTRSIKFDRNAIWIAALYITIGGFWILLSHRLAEAISKNVTMFTMISLYKGWLYVVVTGLILYFVIHDNNSRLLRGNEELQSADKNYRDIFENASVGIFRSTLEGRYTSVNPNMAKIYGYRSPKEMIAEIQNISQQIYVNPEERRRFQKPLAENGKLDDFIGENLRKDGTKIWTSTNARAVKDQAGKLIYYEGFVQEITERKRAEELLQESESRFKSMFEQAPLAINITRNTDILYANPAYIKMFGFSNFDELLKVPPLDLFVPEHRSVVLENIRRRSQDLPVPNEYEVECFRTDRTRFPVLMNFSRMIFADGPATVGFILDNTERKRTEESLKKSEERFHSLYENSTLGLYRTTPDGKILLSNPALVQMLGYLSFEELAQRNLEAGGYEAGYRRNQFRAQIERDGEVRGLESSWKKKDGTAIFIRESAKAIKDSNGKVQFYEGTVEDVTDRKWAEEELRASEERYRVLFEESPISLWEQDFSAVKQHIEALQQQGITDFRAYFKDHPEEVIECVASIRVVDVNKASLKLLHAKTKDDLKKKLNLIIQRESYPDFLNELVGIAEGKSEFEWQGINYTMEGERILVSLRWAVVPGYEQSLSRVLISVIDITARKRAEEAIKTSETRFRRLFESAKDCILILDAYTGYIIDANPFATELLGYSLPELLGGKLWEFVSFKEIVANQNAFQELRRQKYIRYENLPLQTKDGSTVFVEFMINAYDVSGIEVIQCNIRDVTDRHNAEGEVQSLNEFNQGLIQNMGEGIAVEDAKGYLAFVNPAASHMLGYLPDELIGQHWTKLFPKDQLAIVKEANQRRQAGKSDQYEVNLLTKSGERIPVLVSGSPRLNNGVFMGTIAVFTNIAESKQAEAMIRQRLKELELIYENGLELSRILAPEEIAQKIIQQMEKHVDWHHIAIRRYDERSQTLKILGFNALGLTDEVDRQGIEMYFNSLVQKVGDGLSGWVIRHNQTVRIGDLKHDSRYAETFPGLNSGLYAPIKTDHRIIGVISVESELPDAFTESDERLVSTLAAQAAIALENSTLHRETEQQLHQLQALHAIDLAITNSLDLNLTLEVLIQQAVQQLGLDAAAIFVLHAEVQSLKYTAGTGFHTNLLENASKNLFLNDSLAGRTILERHASESLAAEELQKDLKEIWMAEEIHSIYSIPLLTKGEAKGVLVLCYRSEYNPPVKGESDFLEALSNQAAIAIDNIQLFDKLQRSNMELAIAYDATIEGWSRAMDLRDEETEGHTQRVVAMTLKLAADFGFSGSMLLQIRRGALLHDIGKLGVPDRILLKPGKLTEEEWVIMKRHPNFAFEMLAPIQYLNRALNIPYCHHEKWDGTGYPRGLSGEQIPLEARIFAVVDVWDALTSDRPYRKAWAKEKVLEHIRSLSGTHFDPQVVNLFLKEIENVK